MNAIQSILSMRFLYKLIAVCILVLIIDTFTNIPDVFVPALAIVVVSIVEVLVFGYEEES